MPDSNITITPEVWDRILKERGQFKPLPIWEIHKDPPEGYFDQMDFNIEVPTVQGTFELNNIEIFAEGVWNGTKITSKVLDDIIASFGQVPGLKPALTLEHDDEKTAKALKPRLGTVTRVFRKGNKLLADIKNIPKVVYESIKNQSFNSISIQLLRNMKSFTADKTFPAVLGHVTLLGALPKAVETLKDIVDLFEIKKEDFAYEESAIDYEFKCHCNNTDSCDMTSCKNMEVEDMPDKNEELDVATKEFAAKESEWETTKEEFQSKIDKLETEKKDASKKTDEFTKRLETLETENKSIKDASRKAEVTQFVSEQIGNGKILPSLKDQTITSLTLASDEQVVDFKRGDEDIKISHRELLMENIKSTKAFVEKGERAPQDKPSEVDFTLGENDTPGDVLDRLTENYMKKNPDVKDYSEAFEVVKSMPEHAGIVEAAYPTRESD